MMQLLRTILEKLAPSFFLRNTKTIHYAFSLLLLMAFAVGVASVVGSERTSILIESSVETVAENDLFSIRVYAVATTPVNAVSLSIATPSEFVEVMGVDRGESVITLWTSEPKVEGGVVTLEGGTYRRGFVGKHLIATINLKAKKSGQATIVATDANLLAGDGRGTVVATDISKAKRSLAIGTKPADGEQVTFDAAVVIVTDLDGDGAVSLSDISTFMGEWIRQNNRYDFNNDGVMTFKDFSILLANYFKSAS